MAKFERNYILTVQQRDDPTKNIVIQPPFTIEFDVNRKFLSSNNSCNIKVYNLSKANRDQLRFDITEAGGVKRQVELRAGYGNEMPIIFSGDILQAWSVRESVNFISQISALDAGFPSVNAESNNLPPFKRGTTKRAVIVALLGQIKDVKIGAVGAYPEELTKEQSFNGNIVDIINTLSNFGFFIDNGVANVLNPNEVLATGEIKIINAASGLLGTPTRQEYLIDVEMLFEPSFIINQPVRLQTLTGDVNQNQDYSISGIRHRGTISGSIAGSATTQLTLAKLGTVTEVKSTP